MSDEIVKHTEKFFYFYQIATMKSFQATARKLGMTASTLSYSINLLEEVLGDKLFVRSQKGLMLTKSGTLLYSFCQNFFQELDDVHQAIISSSKKQLTRIKIGTFQSIAIYFGPLLLKNLKHEKDLSISITTNRSSIIHESLIKRDIHLALTVEIFKHPNIIAHEIYSDYYSFYVSSKFKHNTISPDELKDYSLLYIPEAVDDNQKTLKQYIHGWNFKFKDHFDLDSLEVIGEFTYKNLGIGILPTNVAKSYGKKIRPISIEGFSTKKFGKHRFFLSYRDDLDVSQTIMNEILESANKAVKDLY